MTATTGLAVQLLRFCEQLRAEGVAVGTSEINDAVAALGAVDWLRPAPFREALAATIAKSRDDRRVFDAVFDRHFFHAVEAEALRHEPAREEPGGGGDRVDLDELRAAVREAIAAGDEEVLRDLARLTASAFGERSAGSRVAGVDLQRIRRELGLAGDPSGAPPGPGTDRFLAELRRELERRAIARTGELPRKRPLRELDRALPTGPAADLAAVHRAVARMRRRLATTGLEQHGVRRRQLVDMRRTIRASLETGGVPMRIRTRPSRPRRPEIFVLCDVSTSVSSASVFFLSVLHALHDSFRRLRSFVFIERISEVTAIFERERDFGRASERISAEGGVADVSGYTDYGRVWREFAAEVVPELDRRATVIVLGDARTNGRDPEAELFASVTAAAGRTFWLNPEPRLYWNYGDSEMGAYERNCTAAFECWTTRHLENFVTVVAGGGRFAAENRGARGQAG